MVEKLCMNAEARNKHYTYQNNSNKSVYGKTVAINSDNKLAAHA